MGLQVRIVPTSHMQRNGFIRQRTQPSLTCDFKMVVQDPNSRLRRSKRFSQFVLNARDDFPILQIAALILMHAVAHKLACFTHTSRWNFKPFIGNIEIGTVIPIRQERLLTEPSRNTNDRSHLPKLISQTPLLAKSTVSDSHDYLT